MPVKNIFELSSMDWNEYVNNHPKGSIFHTIEMQKVFDATPGYEPMFVGARDSRGKIIAILAAVKIEILGNVLPRYVSRSVMFAEPICDDNKVGMEGLARLIDHHDQRWGKKVLYTEVRPTYSNGQEHTAMKLCGYDHLGYLNYVNDLSDGPHVIAPKIKKTIRKIQTSHRRGLAVNQHDADESGVIERVYKQLKTSFGRSRVPLSSIQLFEAANRYLPEGTMQTRIATHENQDVAAAIGLRFKGRYFAWYSGTVRPQGISAAASIVWDEMLDACKSGLQQYDFGGAGWPDHDYGPRIFKSRFGGKLINQGRYRKVSSPMRMAVAKKGFQLLRSIFNSNHLSSISIQSDPNRENENA